MPSAVELAEAFLSHFWSADRAMTWTDVEKKVYAELAPGIVLVGILDGIGPDWFGDWKTNKPVEDRALLKAAYRFDVQTLTYGLLGRLLGFGGKRFTVRWVFKSDPPACDHEWYTYSDAELDAWQARLIELAAEIRVKGAIPGRVNPSACLRYGPKYACPFLPGCASGRFDFVPSDAVTRQASPLELAVLKERPGTTILSATRIEVYLNCPERSRRIYINQIQEPSSEALAIGQDFHALVGARYRALLEERNKENG